MTAAPVAARIPITLHRLGTLFVVVSGHAVGAPSAVASTGLTVVVLMGIAKLPRHVEEFLTAGRASSTPVATIPECSIQASA